MDRLTHKRVNGIQDGYWSPMKKQGLVDALAAYENTELDPEQIRELKERDMPKKIEINAGVPICPVCGRRVVDTQDVGRGVFNRQDRE